jgi:hypothetical protein
MFHYFTVGIMLGGVISGYGFGNRGTGFAHRVISLFMDLIRMENISVALYDLISLIQQTSLPPICEPTSSIEFHSNF